MKRTTSSLLRAHSRGSFSRLIFESEWSNGGGHESRSLLFRLCQVSVMCFRVVTPLSYLYLITLAVIALSPSFLERDSEGTFKWSLGLSSSLSLTNPWSMLMTSVQEPLLSHFVFIFLTVWALLEALFFPYYYYLFTKLNSLNNDLQVRQECVCVLFFWMNELFS